MYRASKRHGSDLFHTRYMLSTAPQQQQQQQHAAAAGSGAGRMCQFTFSPVETATGQFGITVEYQPATTVHFLEVSGLLYSSALFNHITCLLSVPATTVHFQGVSGLLYSSALFNHITCLLPVPATTVHFLEMKIAFKSSSNSGGGGGGCDWCVSPCMCVLSHCGDNSALPGGEWSVV
jgi:hypothetical protein